MFLSRRAALGSSPTIGSSTTMHSGRWIRALEMISFWRMPWLYASTSSSFQLVSSNTSSSSAMRRSIASPSWPYSPATNQKLRARQLVVDERPVGDEAQPHFRRERLPVDVVAADQHPAVGGPQDP